MYIYIYNIYIYEIAVQEITLFIAAKLGRKACVELWEGPKKGCPVSQHDIR